ncbi:MAG: ABC transporter ATP-binding protein [Salinispira sp.]
MLRKILMKIPRRRMKQFIAVTFIMLFSTLTEIMMFGLLGLFITSMINPSGIADNPILAILDNILPFTSTHTDPLSVITILGFAVLLATMVKSLVRSVAVYGMSRYVAGVAGDIGYSTMSALLHAEYEAVLLHNRSEIVQNIEWRNYVRTYLTAFILMLGELSVVILITIGLIAANPVTSLLLFVLIGLGSLLIVMLLKRVTERVSQKVTTLSGSVFTDLRHSINGLKEILISRSEQPTLDDARGKLTLLERFYGKQLFLANLPAIIIEAVGFLVLSGVSIVLINTTRSSVNDVVELLSLFAVALWRIIPGMLRIMNYVGQVRISTPYVRRLLDSIENLTRHSHVWQNNGAHIHEIQTLCFNNVTYKYRTRDEAALKNINFSVNKGKKIGVIGSSGAGKSTLIDILTGLLSPQSGEVRVNNIPLMEANRDDWLTSIGYVSQFPFFHDSSVAANITFGFQHADGNEEYVRQICAQVSMNFLNELPEGIHTRIGEKGVHLSGGQLQRIAIARALYRNPDLIIFDEATSALDSSTEQAIMDTIYSIRGRTMFIIAHRLSTVERCDSIIWIEAGELRAYNSPNIVIPQYEQLSQRHSEQTHNSLKK